jgi:tryptophan 7-halogenase
MFIAAILCDDEAASVLLGNLDGKPLADPRPLKFTTGVRKLGWNKNVVAIGLSSGFLEPLESTSIHLIQSGIQRLIEFFPDRGFNEVNIAEYNRQFSFEFERIRDFIIMHYHVNQRTDSEFWKACASMPIPDSLKAKIELYKARAKVVRIDNELFTEVGWLQVFEGQNLQPEGYSALADLTAESDTHEYLESVREVIKQCVNVMPDHAEYVRQHCAA